MGTEILDEGLEDGQIIAIAWLKDMQPGRVRNTRDPDDPLPFILVEHLSTTENVEESTGEALVSVHTLCDKGLGYSAANGHATRTHQRMVLLSRYLEDVPLSGGRTATIDFVDVAMHPKWELYGDGTQILRKVGRYRIGLSYAKLS